ncbi:phospholipase B1, membrane-associated-like isoform X1 [Tigriopus californicus]|uniref:phospholipase B1, membrane-associated-like isoform X1 n=1 Tax=Tigriopus californicus TaxID=6832 RepID=UPI0027DA9918|nr:phospholipase B1, membrane-associated-like isoform X1 [Tigriopus californicus]
MRALWIQAAISCVLSVLHGPPVSDAESHSRSSQNCSSLVDKLELPLVANPTEVTTAYQVTEDPSALRASLEEDNDHGWRGFYSSTEDSFSSSSSSEEETKLRSLDSHGGASQPSSGTNAFELIKGLSTGVRSFARSLEGLYQLFQTFPSSHPVEAHPHYDYHSPQPEEHLGLNLATLDQLDRSQCRILPHVPFPCPDTRPTAYSPKSVHKLRPGDINLVGALGDHLISGTGALADSITNAGEEFRGVSFATGGDGDWRQYLTIPNLIREFNPKVIGASSGQYGHGQEIFRFTIVSSPLGFSDSQSVRSGFNLADKSATSKDLKDQARNLIRNVRSSATIDFFSDWKLITIQVGNGDICRLTCPNNRTQDRSSGITSKEFISNIRQALDLLKDDLPRTLVNLVPPIDPMIYSEAINRPVACHLTAKIFCPCVFDHIAVPKERVAQILRDFRAELRDMVDSGVYDRTEDFTVVLQPGLDDMSLPKTSKAFFGHHFVDLSYLAPNCIYPSQKLQALMTKAIWNNLLENFDYKSSWDFNSRLRCPTRDEPFLSTYVNSRFPIKDEPENAESPFLRRVKKKKRKRVLKRSADFSCGYV